MANVVTADAQQSHSSGRFGKSSIAKMDSGDEKEASLHYAPLLLLTKDVVSVAQLGSFLFSFWRERKTLDKSDMTHDTWYCARCTASMQSTELIWIIKYGLYADSSPAQAQTNPQVMLLAWSYAGLAFKAQGLRYNLYYRTFCIFLRCHVNC